MARTSSPDSTCTGTFQNAGRNNARTGDAASTGPVRRDAYGSCHASIEYNPPCPSWMKIDAPSAWTASTIGARRITFARVSTHVIPGEVRPSGKMLDDSLAYRSLMSDH